MKKIYSILFIGVSLFGFSQTNTQKISYGWSGQLDTYDQPISVTMPGYDQEKINNEDAIDDLTKDHPWRFGYKYETNFSLENAGDWIELGNGDRIWRMAIKSPGAMTINLLLSDLFIPEGATLFLYDNKRSNKIGAYTSRNNLEERELGTELIHGDHIIVEYYEPFEVKGTGSLTVSNVIHGYRSLNRVQKKLEKGLNDSGSCNVDVNCDLGEGWNPQIRSVAMIVVGGNGICTGALINNTCSDGEPFFLTANHCLGGSTASWAFRFNWESPKDTESCATFDGSTDPGAPYDQTMNGATVLASGGIADFGLLRITHMTIEDAKEWNCFYAGWDNSDEETVTQATGIHHPSGDLKKICREDQEPYHNTASGAQVWWIDDWDQGVTEPGSSGSPLFDQNGRIIGQLFGGAAACSGTDDNDAFDFYGRFGVSWVNGVSDHLIGSGCGSATTNDGFDPNQVCEGISSVSVSGESCFGAGDGSITASVDGGFGPFTYDIGSGPSTSGNFEDLDGGNYTITIIDNTGCEESFTVNVTSPAELKMNVSVEIEEVGADGSINIGVIGGVPGYTYSWTGPDGFVSTDEDISGLVSGLYNVTVTDASGCTLIRENIKVNFYPNPSNGVFNIINEGNDIETITVFDVSGRVVFYNDNNVTGTNLIDLSNKSDGTYIIELTTGSGKYAQRILKR